MTTLTYLQELSIRDRNGNCRCPYCGKYRKRDDFPNQDSHAYFGNGKARVQAHVDPACKYCLEGQENDD